MQKRYTNTAVVLCAAISAVAVFVVTNSQPPKPVVQNNLADSYVSRTTDLAVNRVAGAAASSVVETELEVKPEPKLQMPISDGIVRITKKPFGLKVTPEDSPVSPEIFSGYHTGVDFEAYEDEQNTDVAFMAACEGKVLLKQWAKGYGGVLVQSCNIEGEDITIIYGHVKLESIKAKVGQTLLAGDTIGFLGLGFTSETDNRRKHLHFDIHKSSELNILGYVPKEEDLANWIDPIQYLE